MAQFNKPSFIKTQIILYRERLVELKKEFSEIQKIKNDTESYIFDYFENCIREIDYRRETLFESISEHSNLLINSVKERQAKCFEESKTESMKLALGNIVYESKLKLEYIESMFSSLELNDEVFEEIFFQKRADKRK